MTSSWSGPFHRIVCEFGPVRSGPFREIVDPIISGLSCGKNVTSAITVSCLVAILSSESLPNDGEKPNQLKETFVSEMWLWLNFLELRVSSV